MKMAKLLLLKLHPFIVTYQQDTFFLELLPLQMYVLIITALK